MNYTDQARRSVEASLDDPYGAMSPSVYDTARVVMAHLRRPEAVPRTLAEPGLAFLLRTQSPDAGWGATHLPDGYRLVPTLAAAAALRSWAESDAPPEEAGRCRAAADAALGRLAREPGRFAPDRLPDMGGIEVVVASLLHGEALAPRAAAAGEDDPLAALRHLHAPSLARLDALRAAARSGGDGLPPYIDQVAEVLDFPLHGEGGAPFPVHWAHLLRDEPVGCSPAATAAALLWRPPGSVRTLSYLRSSGLPPGVQPNFLPISAFERAWIAHGVGSLRIPLPEAVTARLCRVLLSRVTQFGVPMGPRAAPDADTTATTLAAAAFLGSPVEPTCLLRFEDEHSFATYYIGESTSSVTTNAHVLDALLAWRRACPTSDPRYGRGAAKAVDFLLASQSPEGLWHDRWHASPYYAAACVVPALARVPHRTAAAVTRAVRTMLDEQRSDGGWGRWGATIDETAHAAHALYGSGLRTDPVLGPLVDRSCRRAVDFLRDAREAGADDAVRTPLWHGKELYEPTRIVRALADSLVAAVLEGDR